MTTEEFDRKMAQDQQLMARQLQAAQSDIVSPYAWTLSNWQSAPLFSPPVTPVKTQAELDYEAGMAEVEEYLAECRDKSKGETSA